MGIQWGAIAGAALWLGSGVALAGEPSRPRSDTEQMNQKMDRATEQGTSATLQQGGTATSATPASDEVKKRVLGIEVYTRGALNQAKLIYQSAELPQGPTDRALWKEGTTAISREIGKAQDHLTQLRKLNAGTQLDEVTSNLRAAKQATMTLQSVLGRGERMAVRDQASALYTQLSGAADALKEIQDAYNVTSIDRISPPEKSRVRGTDSGDTEGMGESGKTRGMETPRAPGTSPSREQMPGDTSKPGTMTNEPTSPARDPNRDPMRTVPSDKSGSDWNKPAHPAPGY